MLLVTIDKFNPNPILVNINKLKPYRFIEDHIFQPILTKPSDFLLEKPMEVTHSSKVFTKQQVEVTHYDNLFNEKPVGMNHFSNLFIEELIQGISALSLPKIVVTSIIFL
jgi:hypothetical protein